MLNILHEKRVWLSFEKVVHRICCCCCSVTKSCSTLCNPMDCSTPGLPVPHHLPEFAEVHVRWSVMSSNHLILCCPLFLLPSIFPSIRVFSGEWAICIGWPNYRSFSFTVSPSNEYSVSIELLMPSKHLILCHPLLLLPSIFPTIGVFSNESAVRIRWPKDWSFRFSIRVYFQWTFRVYFP